MKVDLLLAIFFKLLLGMILGVDKRAGFRHAIDNEEYDILKQLATGKFVKPVKERSKKEQSAVVKFWKSKEKYTVSDDDTSALLYDGKQVCADFLVEICKVLRFSQFHKNILSLNFTCHGSMILFCLIS